MPLLQLNSEISIGQYTFTGVHELRIRKGLHGYMEMAIMQLPTKAYVIKGSRVSEEQTTGTIITEGDPVIIKLGYNGELVTEFEGFVRRRNLAIPLEIECEGYVRKLRLKYMDADLTKGISLKSLLEKVCEGTDISVDCKVAYTIYGRNLVNASGTKVLDEIRRASEGAISIFFIEPKKLWAGLVYTPYLDGKAPFNLPTVKYRLGWNCIMDNNLKERIPIEQVQIIINGMLVTGDSVRTSSDEKVAKRRLQYQLNNWHDESTLKAIANEKQRQLNYTGYEGYVTGLLQPYCAPGWDAYIKDSRYPERDGLYLVESTEVLFGINGSRRIVGIGPKLS